MASDESYRLPRKVVHHFDEQLAEIRTQCIRYERDSVPVLEDEYNDPSGQAEHYSAQLRAVAESRDAPIELVRLARAVHAGKTTWEDIVQGRSDEVPEVAAVRELMFSGKLIFPATETTSRQQAEDDDAGTRQVSPTRHRRSGWAVSANDSDDDGPPDSFLTPLQ